MKINSHQESSERFSPASIGSVCNRGNARTWIAVTALWLTATSPAIAGPVIIYVDGDATGLNDGSSWADAYTDLQTALGVAIQGTEVWVAEGTYAPAAPGGFRSATFAPIDSIGLYGGFAGTETVRSERRPDVNLTILTGDFNQNDAVFCTSDADCLTVPGACVDNTCIGDNSFHVVTFPVSASGTVVDGFTIAQGYANGPAPDDDGAGLYVDSANTALTLSRCQVEANVASGNGGAVLNLGSATLLVNCSLSGNEALNGAGVYTTAGTLTAVNCRFDSNQASGGGGGVQCFGAGLELTNDVFLANTATNGGGVVVTSFGTATLTNCSFAENGASNSGGGVSALNSDLVVANSVFWGNSDSGGMDESGQIDTSGGTLSVDYSLIQGLTGGLGGTGNIGSDPLFVGAPVDDLLVEVGSPVIDAGDNSAVPPDVADLDLDLNTVEPTPSDIGGYPRFIDDVATVDTGNGSAPVVDMGAHEFLSPIFVDAGAMGADDGTSWADAYVHLQDALDDAFLSATDDRIWVAAGTYNPDQGGGETPGDRNASFDLLEGVAIFGGFAGGETKLSQRDFFANATILDGDLSGDDGPAFANNGENSFHVVQADSVDDTAVLDGFTVRGGNANTGSNETGGGLYSSEATPTVRNCRFVANSSEQFGGGAAFRLADVIVRRCTFAGNRSNNAGGLFVFNGNYVITGCEFTANAAIESGGFGGGGGGLGVNNFANAVVANCRFYVNEASTGGGLQNFETTTLVNCVFTGNNALEYGGAVNNRESMAVYNCTFANNEAAISGGGLAETFPATDTIVRNSVFWGNTRLSGTSVDQTAQVVLAEAPSSVDYSIVHSLVGGLGGSNNLGLDPLFIDVDGSDNIIGTPDDIVAVAVGSPCIDRGNNDSLPADAADLDGDGDVTEVLPVDLAGTSRRSDSALVDPDPGNPGVLGPPVVDIGAFEFFEDCQPNGVPDDQDLASGNSLDTNGDGIPDECSLWSGAVNTLYNLAGNWLPAVVPLNDVPPGVTYTPTVSGPASTIDLDISPTVDALKILDDAVFNATGGSLTAVNGFGILVDGELTIDNGFSVISAGPVTVQESNTLLARLADPSGGCVQPPGGSRELVLSGTSILDAQALLVSECGAVIMSDQAQIFVGGGTSLDGGFYVPDPLRTVDTSASLTAERLNINSDGIAPGEMLLEDQMTALITGDVVLSYSVPGAAAESETQQRAADALLGGCVSPPTLDVRDSAELTIEGDLLLSSCYDVAIGGVSAFGGSRLARSGPGMASVVLQGSLYNRGSDASALDWSAGSLTLQGAGAPQTLEVGGVDRCATESGFGSNFDIGTIEVASGATVTFADTVSNTTGDEVQYVDELILRSGSTILIDGTSVYYHTILDEGASIVLENGGRLFVVDASSCETDCDCAASDSDICTVDECVAGTCTVVANAYGDVNHDGVINLFDIFCLLDAIGGDTSQCGLADADIEPCEGNSILNLFDVFAILNVIGGDDPCCS
jgi:hypothetical protein